MVIDFKVLLAVIVIAGLLFFISPIIALILIGVVLVLWFVRREGYAPQVMHAGVGGIAGPVGRITTSSTRPARYD